MRVRDDGNVDLSSGDSVYVWTDHGLRQGQIINVKKNGTVTVELHDQTTQPPPG